MALKHFMRLERTVKIGGRTLGFGPFKRHFGGRDYSIAPISVLRWLNLHAILTPFLSKSDPLNGVVEVLKAMPDTVGRLILPLFLDDLPRECDIKHASVSQILSAWYAFTEVNDLDYILKAYNAEPNEGEEKSAELGLSFEDHAIFLMEKTNGARLPHEFLQLPMQYFLAMFECFRRQKNVQEGRPADIDAPSKEDMKVFESYFAKAGVRPN